MDGEGWGRRWRRVGPGDGLPDGDRNTPFLVFLLLVTCLLVALVAGIDTCPVLQ